MAKPNLALIPATIGTKVYSVLPSDGDGDFTFSRATIATRINSLGLIEEVPVGHNRLNYDLLDGEVYGCPNLLLEPSRTNRIVNSQALSTWGQTNVATTDNFAISPDGTLNASKITDNSTSGNHRIIELSTTVNSSGEATYSIFLKKGTMTTCFVNMFSGSTISNASVNLIDGTITGGAGINHKIEKYPNDWFKVSIQGTLSSTSTYVYLYLKQLAGYVGTGQYLYAWGGQLEEASYPTSYIKTTGSAVTRNAETANGSGNAQTFNDAEGVLMVEISALANDLSYRILSISNSTASERIYLQYTNASNTVAVVVKNGNVTQANIAYVLDNETEFNKVLFKYKQNDFAFWVNGYKVATDTSGNTPVGLSELAFDNGTGGNNWLGNNKQIQYFNTALEDTELEELTSWVSFQEMANGQLYTIE